MKELNLEDVHQLAQELASKCRYNLPSLLDNLNFDSRPSLPILCVPPCQQCRYHLRYRPGLAMVNQCVGLQDGRITVECKTHNWQQATTQGNQTIRDRDWNELESNLFSNLVLGMIDNP